MLILSTARAIAPAPIPDLGPDLPLFERVGLLSVKANSEEPTCEASLESLFDKAIEIGAKEGLTEILAIVPADLASPPMTAMPCKLTGIPDAPSGATSQASFLLAKPGTGFPTVSRRQQTELVGLLTAVHEVDVAEIGLVKVDERIWVDAGVREHEEVLPVLSQNSRAVQMLRTHVVPWVTRWSPLSSTMPHIAGAMLTLDVRSEAEKGKNREHFTYRVAAAEAAQFTVGQLAEPEWAATLGVSVVENPKKPVSKPLALDLDGAGGSAAVSGRTGIGSLDDIKDE